MNTSRLRDLRAAVLVFCAALGGLVPLTARAQFAGVLATDARYAGNSTGTPGFNSDTGTATATSLNAPSYVVFDAAGNLFVSDTANNCVRKVDTSGNISTVAGLRVSSGPDTCNTLTNASPTAAQGLLRPAGLAVDAAGTLYIADSQHHCVRSLASGVSDTFAANALTTVAGTCGGIDTGSATPVPNGLAVDASLNLYISLQDTTAQVPVNQVVRHLSGDPAGMLCYVAGQPSANVPGACPGSAPTVTLSSPAGLALDHNGSLFVADTGNNCVREITGAAAPQTAVGLCANDHTGSSATALHSPYGLAFSPTAALVISQASLMETDVVSFDGGAGTLTVIAGLPSGAPGPYSAAMDGGAALSAPLNAPEGLTFDAAGGMYLADSQNNVVRQMSTGLVFAGAAVDTAEQTQNITFGINQAVNLTAGVGTDYSIASNTCSGLLVPSTQGLPPNTCQVAVRFTPSRPGARNSALQLKDSISGKSLSFALEGTGIGPLSLFTPGTVASVATGLRNPIAVSVDSAGDAYVLEQGDGATSADVVLLPAGGGALRTIVPQHSGLQTATAMAVDGAGNVFVADAAFAGVTRFGADGTVDTSYVTGLVAATALALDGSGNLYIAQSGPAHNVIEVYANGTRRTVAGSGATANADSVPASAAQFVAPSALVLGPGGLSVADASGHRVYTIDPLGTIHIVAGNGTTTTSSPGQAVGTALLAPVGIASDAAGDLYISDQAANRVYEVFPVVTNGSNIATVVGTGAAGYTGDGGPGPAATLQGQLAVGLDGAADLFVVDNGNSALRELTYPVSPVINFGDIIIGTTSRPRQQSLANAGNANLAFALPFTTTDSHYAVSMSPATTTCGSAVVPGEACSIGYTFSPSALGPVTAQSNLVSNSYNQPQTVQLTGYGLYTQSLPYALTPETEIYGQPFTETATVSLVYPDLIPTGTMAYTIAGLTTCTISGDFPGITNCQAPSSGLSVGSYMVTFSYTAGDLSYYSTTSATTLTVTPGTLSVTPANVSKAYGAAIPALPASVLGAVNGDLFLASDTTTATPASPVGTYPIIPTLTGVSLSNLQNYTVTYNTGTLTVTPIPLTVTIGSATRVYGTANPPFSSTIAGAINGDTFTVTYSTAATAASAAGAYAITATVTGANIGNYAVTVVPGTLTVTQATLMVTVGDATRMYGAPNPTFTSTITGALNGDTFTNNFSTTATAGSPVGTYPITDALGGSAAANYIVTVVPGTLTITQSTAALSIAVNNVSRAYGAANPTFTSTVTGALNGDSFTITYATAATVLSLVGTYAIVPTVSGAALSNYATVSTTNGALTVTAAPLTITVASASRVYGAANPSFSGTTAGLVNGDTVNVTYSSTAVATSPVGTYPISATISGAAAANYAVTVVPGTLTITRAALTVTVANASRTYGAANPTFSSTVSGALNGDTFVSSYSTTATQASPVGTYPVTDTLSGAAAANYSVTVLPGTLTITQATATLTFTANNTSRPYGAANPVFTGTVTGALNGDTFSVSYSTSANATSPVGTYTIVPAVSGSSLNNYAAVTTANGVLTVTPATLTVTVANASRAYGAANPVFTGTIAGAANGDTFTFTYATSATTASPAGAYPITATAAGGNLSNYSLNVVSGTLTVNPAPLTVTVASASRAYGAANPVFSSTITGALNGDTLTNIFSTTASAASPVGAYPISDTLSGPSAANYAVTLVPGTLTITQATATLTVAANNAARTYGAANPAFTSTITGALNGDTFTITYTTPATAASPVGMYTITPSVSGAAVSNYTLATANGTLTVTQAPLTIAANNATRLFGAPNPVFTGSIAGLLNGDTVTLSFATPATPSSPVGPYPIVPSAAGAALSNYAVTANSGTLTITPSVQALTVTVNNATRGFGAANPIFTSTIVGLANGDAVTVNYTTTATAASGLGAYPIAATVSGPAAANYTITVVPGTLTVTLGATATSLATSASPVLAGTSITFTATVSSVSGVPVGTVNFFNGTTLLGSATLDAAGIATFTTSTLPPGTYTISGAYQGSPVLAVSSASLTEIVSAGTFTLSANPPSQFIRGPGSTVYTVTVASVQNFNGPVTLSCSGLPADASCNFAAATLNLTTGGTATTTMTLVNTAADARLDLPRRLTPDSFAPVAVAAVFPFELTGMGVCLAGWRRRRPVRRGRPRGRMLLLVLASVAMLGLAGCACFTSVYQNYTIVITGTSTTAGTGPQSASVVLSVGQQ